ncbi:MAG: type VI secretion system membrane subunit TssM [Pyrinomonadaceae bacterium]
MDQLKYALGIGGLFSFYGIVGILVWLVGDQYGYGWTERIVIILLVLITLPIALVIGFIVSRRRKKKELQAETKAEVKPLENEPAKASSPAGNNDDLTKSAEEVIQFLKSSNLGNGGKDAIYSLPWYLVMGTPKSGKSSLVLGSNLDFQNLPSQRQTELKFLRPTRNVDWRVTSEAVFLDTAGRFQTEGVDGDEWNSLLEIIKKFRPNRPLDGVLMTVSAEKILHSDERQIEEQAKILRTRLDEASQRLKTRFPVYIVFTHADAIEGFRDSFSNSKQEDKSLVWGATIPLEKSDNAQSLFDGEYELLQDSVLKRRLMRLSSPFQPARQLRIFNFPLHFGSARRKLGAFISTLFRPNPFSESPFLRGFYFTAVPVNRQQVDMTKTLANIPQTVGKTYFTERLFRDVVLRDKDLVKTFQQQKQKPPIWGWIFTVFAALIVFSLLALAGISLYKNKQILAEAEQKGGAVLTIVKANRDQNPLGKDAGKTRDEINAINDLRDLLVRLDDNERNGAPIYMRFGLYSGNRIYKSALLPVYFNAVEKRFKEPVVKKLEDDLRKFDASQITGTPEQQEVILGKHYDLLKAYLMLSGGEYKDTDGNLKNYKEKADPTTLKNALKDYWQTESKTPSGMDLIALEQLDFWAKQVDRDESPANFPRIKLDENLVNNTRVKLKEFPPVFRYYQRKISEISKETEEKHSTISADRILANAGAEASFLQSSVTVPSAYTIEGYQLMKKAISEADQELSKDDWVMGELGKNGNVQTTDSAKLQSRYFRDYADSWKAFIKSVNVIPYKDKTIADNALLAFSSANSPMEILLKEVARQTKLSAKPEPDGWIEWLWSFLPSSDKSDKEPVTDVEKEFDPLYAFLGDKDAKNTQVEKYRTSIGQVSNKFGGFRPDELKTISQDLARNDDKNFPQLRRAENDIRSQLGVFNSTSTGQEIADLLKEPLGNLQILLGADVKSQVAKNWKEQIFPKAQEIEKGFPFDSSQTESDLTKLSAFLNPANGTLSDFFNKNLKVYFDGEPGQFKLKEGSQIKFSQEFVTYLNNAFRLRRALYGESGASPKYEYEFKLLNVKDSIIEVSIDGQKLNSEGTASTKLTFPAGSGAETGVFMQFGSTSSTVQTAPASNSSANTNASNVNSSSSTNVPVSKFLQGNNSSSSEPLKFPGNWGLFRFVAAGSPNRQAGGEYLLNYKFAGKTVNATVKPSGEDLFDRNIFSALKAPENILAQ